MRNSREQITFRGNLGSLRFYILLRTRAKRLQCCALIGPAGGQKEVCKAASAGEIVAERESA